MSDLIAAYKKLILPKAVCGIDTSRKSLTLKEEKNRGRQNVTDKVVIFGLPDDCFAFTLDIQGYSLSDLIGSTVDGVRDKCDAVLAAKIDEILYLLFIELKSGQASGYTQQLRSAACFADYLDSLAKNFLSAKFKAVKRVNVLFHQPASVQSSRRDVVSHTVKGMRVVKSSKTHVYLNELIEAA